MRRCLASGLLAMALACAGTGQAQERAKPERGGETLTVCFNYGCYAQADVSFSEAQLAEIKASLRAADAAEEREHLARALGRLYAWAGAQSPLPNSLESASC